MFGRAVPDRTSRCAWLPAVPPGPGKYPITTAAVPASVFPEKTAVQEGPDPAQFAAVIQIGGQPLTAEGPLAGPFADAAAQSDGVEAGITALFANRCHELVDNALGHHFTFAEQHVLGIVLPDPQAGGQPRFGPAGIHGLRQRVEMGPAGLASPSRWQTRSAVFSAIRR